MTRSSGSFVRALCVSMMTMRSPSGSGIVGPLQFAKQVVRARADPDRNGERQTSGNGQTRILQQHPDAELVILQHVSSP